jgi:hypothetical protein
MFAASRLTPYGHGRQAPCPWPPAIVTPPAGSQSSQWQVSRRPLARGCFAGRSLVFRPSLGGSLHFATSSRPPAAPFAVHTRPPCAPLSRGIPGQPRPAGQPLQSLSFASFDSPPPLGRLTPSGHVASAPVQKPYNPSGFFSSPSTQGLGLASAPVWG